MIWNWFKRRHSAPVARERLQILLAHERSTLGRSNLVAVLQDEILSVISRHVFIDPDSVQVKMDRGATISTLEIEIEIPNMVAPPLAVTY
ncbi:cell division topological specificity factor MinE [Rhodoplanes sp. TEM]|uniref:Cell division topological specificity factor n=1 Tax=Rhodoplanes tepidamans TaxID=200616 RepID=A0ABT5J4W2_RHOTP|nr:MULTISPECIES: cell division topological specificity factor MinE [Rhodoplanes]MDC7784675.1 cell division topological specificity factor MinE [Rhodoplanes tepidamans]MDC7982142.1 cell division topological specificity factor MinE [Rhodoplanes sp. TEM]MDQ0356146.1 cell division topological specificity factor [Rhodoplanes tepidamans]